MTEAIDQMLDELVASSIHIEQQSEDDTTHAFKLTLSYDIKVPPLSLPRSSSGSTPGAIRWYELVRALTLLDVATEKLRPLQKALIRQLLQPLIQHHQHVSLQIDSTGSYASTKGSSISLEATPRNNTGNEQSVFLGSMRVAQ